MMRGAMRLLRGTRGATMAIAALTLPVMLGMGALAVDVGYLYVARNVMQNAADAGARAGASVLAQTNSQANATQAALTFANQNLATAAYLTGAVSTVSFPTPTTVRVDVADAGVGLFFGRVIGFNSTSVNVNATAGFTPVSAGPPNSVIPLAIYCNNPNGCNGQLAVGQLFNRIRRYCGNYFGSSSSPCNLNPSAPSSGEVFLTGITLDDVPDVSNSDFRNDVLNGFSGKVSMGQLARALPGDRQGWETGMTERLAQGQIEMTLAVVAPQDPPVDNYNVRVVDFVRVRMDAFYPMHGNKLDEFDMQIVRQPIASTDFAQVGQGLGIGSSVGIRMIQ